MISGPRRRARPSWRASWKPIRVEGSMSSIRCRLKIGCLSAIALVLALPLPAWGASRKQTFVHLGKAGGQNTKGNPIALPEGDLLEARNVVFDVAGAWATRKGYDK